MYIDGDTHYWPLRFIDKVSHPGKGHVEVTPDKGDMIRFGEAVPGKWRPTIATARKFIRSRKGAGASRCSARVHEEGRLRYQVLIPDNRPLIYEFDRSWAANWREHTTTPSRKISGATIALSAVAWVYLPDIQESIRELRRAVKDLGFKAVKFNGG